MTKDIRGKVADESGPRMKDAELIHKDVQTHMAKIGADRVDERLIFGESRSTPPVGIFGSAVRPSLTTVDKFQLQAAAMRGMRRSQPSIAKLQQSNSERISREDEQRRQSLIRELTGERGDTRASRRRRERLRAQLTGVFEREAEAGGEVTKAFAPPQTQLDSASLQPTVASESSNI